MIKVLRWLREWDKRRSRRVSKLLYGVEELPKRPMRVKVVSGIIMMFLLSTAVLYGYTFGYFTGTGIMPFGPQTMSTLPPEIQSTTSQEVEEFVKSDDTNLKEYDVGFNCVEYAFLQARNAHWKGIPAYVVRISFEDSDVGHLILGFPTEDEGWKFLQPQGEVWVKPRVGGMFLDKRVVGLYYLSDFVWEAIETKLVKEDITG